METSSSDRIAKLGIALFVLGVTLMAIRRLAGGSVVFDVVGISLGVAWIVLRVAHTWNRS